MTPIGETRDSAALDRAFGCFIGLAVGDAVGTTLEFKPRDTYAPLTDMAGGGPFALQPGEWTDDTSMALCLAESLVACGRVEPGDLMARFRRWYEHGHNAVHGECFDIGNTTRAAIMRYVRTGDPLAGSASPRFAGNGSIMRLAPVALFHSADAASAEDAAELQSRTTHATPETLDACRLLARLLVRLIAGVPWSEALAEKRPRYGAPAIDAISRLGWKAKDRAAISSSGYVVHTLEAALWSVDRTSSFRDAVLLAANLGDDADTVAAVTGQLAGARYGYDAIPAAWRAKLAWHDRLRDLAKDLVAR